MIIDNIKVGADKLSDVISIEKDVVKKIEIDEETGDTIVVGYILKRIAVEKLKLYRGYKIQYGPLLAMDYKTSKGGVYTLLTLSANCGDYKQLAGVWEKNLRGLGKYFPVETLKYRVDARLIISLLGLGQYGVLGEDELMEDLDVSESKIKDQAKNLDLVKTGPKLKLKRGKRRAKNDKKDNS